MTTDAKVTKKNVLNAIYNYFVQRDDIELMDDEIVITVNNVLDFVDVTLKQLEKKAATAKKKAAEKRAVGDELRAKISAVLTDEYKTIAEIVAEVDEDDLTAGKVTARLTQLVKLGEAHKTKVKVGDRTLTAYATGPATESVEVNE